MSHVNPRRLEKILRDDPAEEPPGPILPHLLDCPACQDRLDALSRPGLRTDLFPEADCPDDAALQQLAPGDRPAHLRDCLWCALVLHDLRAGGTVDVAVPEALSARCAASIESLHRSRGRVSTPWRSARTTVLGDVDAPVRRLIPRLVYKSLLPALSPDGRPLEYRLFWSEGGRFLSDDERPRDAGVRAGHHLSLFPELSATARSAE